MIISIHSGIIWRLHNDALKCSIHKSFTRQIHYPAVFCWVAAFCWDTALYVKFSYIAIFNQCKHHLSKSSTIVLMFDATPIQFSMWLCMVASTILHHYSHIRKCYVIICYNTITVCMFVFLTPVYSHEVQKFSSNREIVWTGPLCSRVVIVFGNFSYS